MNIEQIYNKGIRTVYINNSECTISRTSFENCNEHGEEYYTYYYVVGNDEFTIEIGENVNFKLIDNHYHCDIEIMPQYYNNYYDDYCEH